jgi:spore maturation protein SpmB
MGLVIATTFALSLWVILTSLGVSSFDGIMLALLIILLAAGTQLLGRYVGSVGPGSRD